MAPLTSSALCLLGILICGSFLEAEAARCARGWKKHKGYCYKLFVNKLTWMEAQIQCQNYGCGAHLASFHSKEESDWVANYIHKHKNVRSRVWMGLIDFRQDGKWRWSDGSAFNYKAWMKNQPDNYQKAEYCGELTPETQFKQWNDMRCNQLNPYLCKHKLWRRL